MIADQALLRAVIGRMIPRDADAGALEAGTDGFVLARLSADAADAELVSSGLASLAAQAGGFADRSLQEQDSVLHELEGEAWFERLVTLVSEGFYADPDNGGNAGAVSWTMIGYRHGLPEGPSGPARGEGER